MKMHEGENVLVKGLGKKVVKCFWVLVFWKWDEMFLVLKVVKVFWGLFYKVEKVWNANEKMFWGFYAKMQVVKTFSKKLVKW